MRTLTLALLGAAAIVASPAAADNLVKNGSFEDGFDYIQTSGTGTPTILTYGDGGTSFGQAIPMDDVASPLAGPVGNHALYFSDDNAMEIAFQDITLVAGQTYTGGFDVFIPSNGTANPIDATLSAYASAGGVTVPLFSVDAKTGVGTGGVLTPDDWYHFEATAVSPYSGSVTFNLAFNSTVGGTGAGADFVVDEAFLAAVPEPATWAMMIGGFGLVGGALRRRRAVAAIA